MQNRFKLAAAILFVISCILIAVLICYLRS